VVSWIAPDVARIDEPFTGPERGILDGFLDWHRSTLLWKCAGLTGEQLALASVQPSNLSLLGIVRHMADMERAWFRIRFRGEPLPRLYDYEDAAFEHAGPARAEADFAAFAEECDLARKAVARASLDDEFTGGRGRTLSLRWVYTHMIEEYARHNGHADLLRQRIDGATGSLHGPARACCPTCARAVMSSLSTSADLGDRSSARYTAAAAPRASMPASPGGCSL
jgi:uncharacterized damage-inducible protein DinB